MIFDDYSLRSINGGSVVGSRQPNILVIHLNFKLTLKLNESLLAVFFSGDVIKQYSCLTSGIVF